MSFFHSSEHQRQRSLDLEPLTFIDCSGLHAVFDPWEVSRRNGFNLQIVGARGVVRRVLHLARLEDVLPLVDEPLAP